MHFDEVGKIVAMAWNSPLTVAEAAAKVFPAEALGPGRSARAWWRRSAATGGRQWVVMTLVIWLLSNWV